MREVKKLLPYFLHTKKGRDLYQHIQQFSYLLHEEVDTNQYLIKQCLHHALFLH